VTLGAALRAASRTSLLLSLSLLPAACATAPRPGAEASEAAGAAAEAPAVPQPPIRLTLVGTNDLHGWVMPQRAKLADGTEVEQGGLATLAGYVDVLRQENPDGVLLLDGGDLFQGTLASNLTEGALVVRAMNALRYDAAALGNHEFDFGPVGARAVAQAGDDPFGALKGRIEEARFPILAANVTEAEGGKTPSWLDADGVKMVERNGVKVALIGLATPHTPEVTNPVNVASLRFHPLAASAAAAAKAAREAGAEVVVALAHAGAVCKKWDDPRDTSSCNADDAEIFDLLNALPEGTLDAVVAGHTHQTVGHFIRGTPVVETTGKGRTFGLIELFVDPVSRKVRREQTQLQAAIPVCPRVDVAAGTCDDRALKAVADKGGKLALVPATFRERPVVPDAGLQALLGEALAKVEQEQNRPLGVAVPERLRRSYEGESPLGLVLADALRGVAAADVALVNSGGIRAELPAGDLTYGAVFEVLPFDNTVSTVKVTSEELTPLLESAFARRGGVLQVSGLKLTLEGCEGQPLKVTGVSRADGKPLPKGKVLTVAMPDFLARGGSGMDVVLSKLPAGRIDLGESRALPMRDAFIDYWQKQKKPLVPPARGRVTRTPPKEGCAAPAPARQP
jgi:5'-nucleotidase